MNYELFSDELMTFFTSGPYEAEVQEAKLQYYGGSGPIDAEEQDYEQKMIQFAEWYLFTRKLNQFNVTPAERAKDEEDFHLTNEFPKLYQNLLNHRHSLFEFLKLSKNDLYIRDIISKYKFVIKDSPVTIGFNKGEVFEARVIPHGQSYCFMKSFCFHPPQATKFINKEVKIIQKNKNADVKELIEQLIKKLKTMKQKFEQYKHVAVESIYSNDAKI